MPKELIWLVVLFAVMGVLQFFAGRMYQKNKDEAPKTLVTEEELTQFDELPAGIAVSMAWAEPEEQVAQHRQTQKAVRAQMPILGRSLDRMIESDSSKGVK
jgi:hypothetical protein